MRAAAIDREAGACHELSHQPTGRSRAAGAASSASATAFRPHNRLNCPDMVSTVAMEIAPIAPDSREQSGSIP